VQIVLELCKYKYTCAVHVHLFVILSCTPVLEDDFGVGGADRLSVRPSVTSRYLVKTVTVSVQRITRFTPLSSPATLVF